MIKYLLFVISMVVPSCKTNSKISEIESPPTSQSAYQVEIIRLAENNWSIIYTFPQPIKQLNFYSNWDGDRSQVFVNSTDEIKWETDQTGLPILKLEYARKKIKFTHADFAKELQGGYEFHNTFRDGSILINTIYYAVYGLYNEQGEWIKPPTWHYIFRDESANYIVIGDQKTDHTVGDFFASLSSPFTYVFLGRNKPLDQGSNWLIYDDDLPAHLKNHLKDSTAKIFHELNSEFYRLAQKPWVYFSFDPEYANYDQGGGVLPNTNVAQFDIRSKLLTEERNNINPTLIDNYDAFFWYFSHLISHELSHLWNMRSEKEWLWEGLAEYQAYVFLKEQIPTERFNSKEFEKRHYEDCLQGIEQANAENQDRHFYRNFYYGCGYLFQLLFAKELTKQNLNYNTVWSEVFKNAITSNRVVTFVDVENAVTKLKSPRLSQLYQLMVKAPTHEITSSLSAFQDLLVSLGLELPQSP